MLALMRIALTLAVLVAPALASTCSDGEVAFILNMTDTYGDGWNDAVYTLTHSSDGSTTTGTLDADSWGTTVLCLVAADNNVCHPFAVSAGSYPSEVGWSIVNEEGVVTASGGAPTSVCIRPPLGPPPPPMAPVTAQLGSDGDDSSGGDREIGEDRSDEKIGASSRRSGDNSTTSMRNPLFGE